MEREITNIVNTVMSQALSIALHTSWVHSPIIPVIQRKKLRIKGGSDLSKVREPLSGMQLGSNL